MRVFVTGASGWIGSAAVDDLDSLRCGAAEAEAVVHLANLHDWGNPAESDRAALETDASPAVGPDADRGGSEYLVLAHAERGVRAVAVRFAPSVHGIGDWGFVAFLTRAARERGVSGYVGDGSAQWSAVHRRDAARLIRLGAEQAPAGTRLHAVAEPAVSTREIAEAIVDRLDVPATSIDPADAVGHFGFVGDFFAMTVTASSELARELLPWTPTGPGLIDDIRAGAYTNQ